MTLQLFVITRSTSSGFAYLDRGRNYPDTKDLTKESAIELSILKWKKIIRYIKGHPGVQILTGGPITCGLCTKYYNENCTRCPIKKKTNSVLCEGTPHMAFCEHRTVENAQKELEFLQSLVKKEVK